MVNDEIGCKGTTKSGNKCNLPANNSGYCYIHDPARHAAQEEAAQRAKAEVDAESKRRRYQLELVSKEISSLENTLQQYKILREKHRILVSVVDGLYVEIEKLTKKAPAEQITNLALEQINDVIKDTKELIQEDPYIQKLKVFVPTGDLPQLRDALIVLRQVKQGLDRVSWNTDLVTERLNQARIVQLAIKHALDGETSHSTLQKIRYELGIPSKEWTIKDVYGHEEAFDFERLDSINIQEYFKVE